MAPRPLSWILASFLLFNGGVAAETEVIIYPQPVSSEDTQYEYDYELLRVALDATVPESGDYELRPSKAPMNQARAASEIISGSGLVSIMARSTALEHERAMLPVRIPIDKGLISYRIFLIRSADQPRFSGVRSIEDLRAFSVGSFVTWTDTLILQDGGFNVVAGDSYEGLFVMLSAGRFDFFSRGVDEAFREYDERKAALPDLKVEDELLLHFPTTRYFFVGRNPGGEALARRVALGLNRMIADGRFDTLFRQYKGPLIEQANLKGRRLFRIPNPYLSPQTPLDRHELWFDPFAER